MALIATLSLGLGLGLGCQSPSSNVAPVQKTGEGPSDPSVKTEQTEQLGKKKVVFDEDPQPNPDGIDLKPVGQGGGPKLDDAPSVPPPAPPPVVKKPTPKPTTTASTTPSTTPSSSAPPVWTVPLPSGWAWPFPNNNVPPPAGSTTNAPPTGSTTLPPFGGS